MSRLLPKKIIFREGVDVTVLVFCALACLIFLRSVMMIVLKEADVRKTERRTNRSI